MAPARIISRSTGVEYIEVAKSGCSSIKTALLASDGLVAKNPYHVHTHEHWRDYDPAYVPAFRFSFVRHPVLRCLSAYREKIRNNYAKRAGLDKTASLHDYLTWLLANPRFIRGDKHFMPQTALLLRQKPADFIGRLECVPRDWVHIQQWHALPDLPQINPSTGAVEVTANCLGLIWEIYQHDFNCLHYNLHCWEHYNAYLLPAPHLQPLPADGLVSR